jgi:5,10-methylene-tetrahydrofolate dehydrogenase/methenyl tetrahydrofolate cyclohydrolase
MSTAAQSTTTASTPPTTPQTSPPTTSASTTPPTTPPGIIDGRLVAKQINAEIREQTAALFAEHNTRPGLSVFLVGEHAESAHYVKMKRRAAERAGFNIRIHELAATTSVSALLAAIGACNGDAGVHGILVQLPLPEHMRAQQHAILESVDVRKDVDGFHPYNIGRLSLGGVEPWEKRSHAAVATTTTPTATTTASTAVAGPEFLNVPCAPLGCIELLDRYGVDIIGKHVVVLGRSSIVGLPVSLLFMHRGATVTNCFEKTQNCAAICRLADIVVCAVGQARLVTRSWIKPGAVVLDVGFNYVRNDDDGGGTHVCGDVDFDDVAPVTSLISPVPGGVGPMTVAMLLRNTLRSAQQVFKNHDATATPIATTSSAADGAGEH